MNIDAARRIKERTGISNVLQIFFLWMRNVAGILYFLW
jgi:hypothetical protein